VNTKHRVINAACVAFSNRGVAGTSLDDIANDLGITKQAILYHFNSKNGLISAVLSEASMELLQVFVDVTLRTGKGWDRVEEVVRAAFSLAVRKPELLGLLREVNRLGEPWSNQLIKSIDPLIKPSVHFLREGMHEGLFKKGDPQLVLASAYSAVIGVVGDVEVLRAVGLELDLRVATRLRRTLLGFLRSALVG